MPSIPVLARSRRRSAGWRLTGVCFIWSAIGCYPLPEIDVCERQLPPQISVNVLPEGNQRSDGIHAVVPAPLSGAFAVFSSDVSHADANKREIRGTLLDDAGRRVDTCGSREEITYVSAAASPAVQFLASASIAPPPSADNDENGLIAYIRLNADAYDPGSGALNNTDWQVYGKMITDLGCQLVDPIKLEEPLPPFLISAERANHPISSLVPVALGNNRFVVFWVALEDPYSLLRARVFDWQLYAPSFLPIEDPATLRATTGEPVSLRPSGEDPLSLDALALSSNRIALAWTSAASHVGGGIVVHFTILDDRLRYVLDPVVIDDAAGVLDYPFDNQVALAYDGHRFMVAWAQRGSDGSSRAYGRFLDVPWEQPASLFSVEMSTAFRLSHRAEAEEGRVSLSPQTGGGFVAVWEEQEASNSGDSGFSLRLAAFGPSGAQQFTNQACDATDFRLDRSAGGNQLMPSLARTASGSIFAMWTDFGPTEINQRGSSEIRLVAIGSHDLLPMR